MISIGIIGFNSIDISDLEYLISMNDVEIEGCYIYHKDTVPGCHGIIGKKIKQYASFVELIKNTDCLICYYDKHPACFSMISQALKHAKHIFIKNPFAIKNTYLKQLIDLATEAGVNIKLDQEYLNKSVFQAIKPHIDDPQFIRIEHLEKFNETTAGSSVINNKLIADIDMVLSILRYEIRKIHANGISVDGYTHDMLNASIEFNNGCVVNILKSRLSDVYRQEMSIFQKNNTISVDYSKQKATITQWPKDKQNRLINQIPLAHNSTPTQYKISLKEFCDTVRQSFTSLAAVDNFYMAQHLAKNIYEKIKFVTKEV